MLTRDVLLDPGHLAILGIAAYLILELVVSRSRNDPTRGEGGDRGSLVVILSSLALAIVVGLGLRGLLPQLDTPGSERAWAVAGFAVLVSGMALRGAAIRTLGEAYSPVVKAHGEQLIVTSGPYHRLRHPAYSGLLLMTLGAGITCAHWATLVASVVFPLAALIYRIQIEESALHRALGGRYQAYAHARKRLIPGVW